MQSTTNIRLVHVSTESASGGRSPQMSYLSSTRSHRVSLGHIDIFCCIFIPVVMSAAFRTVPLTNVKRKRFDNMPAARTHFTGWKESIYRFQFFAIPITFIRDLTSEHTESNIENRTGETMISCHTSHIQVLDANSVILSNQIGSELVQRISSTVSDMFMQPSNLNTLPMPSTTTFLTSRKNTLQPRQFRQIMPKMLRVCNTFSGRKGSQSIYPQVNSDFLSSLRQWFDSFIKAESDIVSLRRFLDYRNRGGDTFETSAPMYIETAKAGKNEIFIDNIPFESTDSILSGLLVSFLFECWVFSSFCPEIQECCLQMPERLLSGNTRNIRQPFCSILFLQNSQHCGSVKITDSFLLGSPCFRTKIQCPIIDIAATTKDTREFFDLHVSRIKSKSVSCLHTIIIHYVKNNINNYFKQGDAKIPPTVKTAGFLFA